MAASEMRNAAADHRVDQFAATGDAQPAVIEESAATALGGVELVHRRVVDDAGDDLALALQRDGNGKQRNAVQEIGGAVQRVDDPAVLGILALHHAAFLHQEGIARARLGEFGEDDLLGLAIGLADIVARSLQRHLEVLDFAEVA